MTDTKALRALAADDPASARDWVDDAQDEMRAAADTIDALRAEVAKHEADWNRYRDQFMNEIRAANGRAETAERAIADAPHGNDAEGRQCELLWREGFRRTDHCTCWKSDWMNRDGN